MEYHPKIPNMNTRAANFTRSEESRLISLVEKYAEILENKKTDNRTNQNKTAAWVQIEKEYNSGGAHTYRSVVVLKNKYVNLKKKFPLRKFSIDKKEHVFKDEEISNGINDIIESQIIGSNSEYDNEITVEHIPDENVNGIHNELPDINPIDDTLRNRLSRWPTTRQECLNVQQKCILDESNQKLRHKEEIHQLDLIRNKNNLRMAQEEHKFKMQMVQEEHELKMSILKLQRDKLLKELSQ